jgi:hypothetical protein
METIADSPLLPVAAALLGGLFSYLAVYTTQRVTQQRERMQYRCGKLERGYLLAQLLYDGHKGEIDKLAMIRTMTPAEWMKIRKHPGEVMNELRMIVWMYAPRLETQLESAARAHTALKEAFVDIDRNVRDSAAAASSREKRIRTKELLPVLEGHLSLLARETRELKKGLAGTVQKIMRTSAGSADPE